MNLALVSLCLTVSFATAQTEPELNDLHPCYANGDSGGTLTARQDGDTFTLEAQLTTADGTPLAAKLSCSSKE